MESFTFTITFLDYLIICLATTLYGVFLRVAIYDFIRGDKEVSNRQATGLEMIGEGLRDLSPKAAFIRELALVVVFLLSPILILGLDSILMPKALLDRVFVKK